MGGSTANAPAPTSEETALQKYQLYLLQQQGGETEAMRPILLAQMGYKMVPKAVPPSVAGPNITFQAGQPISNFNPDNLDETARDRGGPYFYDFSPNTRKQVVQKQFPNGQVSWTPTEDITITQYGELVPPSAGPTYDIVPMTQEERDAMLSPEQKLDLELKKQQGELAKKEVSYQERVLQLQEAGFSTQEATAKAQLELQQQQITLIKQQIEDQKAAQPLQAAYMQRQLDALEGKLPISPQLEANITAQENMMKNELSAKLGPNWMLSTPGIQAMAEFKKNAELTREEARRGQIASGAGLVEASLTRGTPQFTMYGPQYTGSGYNMGGGGTGGTGATATNTYGLLDRIPGLLQPYQTYNQMGFNANIQNAQMGTARQNAYIGAGATVVGTAAGVGIAV